ncbi:hypothetical protein K3495_g14493 [Podosphaera aphanis]|nr:hypothetical protein K3495_g14493 [Podosphaera aphanis]
MELEACLCPPEVRLNHYRRKYAMRSLELMQNHPVARALAENRIFHHANMDNDDIGHSEGIRDQLRSINKSIPAEVDIRNLEVISNRDYPPWKRNLPYTVKIGKLPKEEEVLLHQAKVTELKGSSTIVYYTDASFYAEATGIGTAFKAFDQKTSKSWAEYNNIGPENIVFNGELEAITAALEHARRICQYRDHIIIFSDSQAALQRLKSYDNRPGQMWLSRSLKAARELQEQGVTITLEWVPGHSDILGNIEVDKMAKEAAQELPDQSYPMSLAYLSKLIRDEKNEEWNDILSKFKSNHPGGSSSYLNLYPRQIRKKVWTPRGTKKEICSAYYQLKLGHGYFKSYLKRIGKTTDDMCLCGGRQTPRHLLLECRRYKKNRKKMKDSLCITRLTLPLLLHTNRGVSATLEFIKETKIATRRWYLGETEEDNFWNVDHIG